jgi:hypothetical protein
MLRRDRSSLFIPRAREYTGKSASKALLSLQSAPPRATDFNVIPRVVLPKYFGSFDRLQRVAMSFGAMVLFGRRFMTRVLMQYRE